VIVPIKERRTSKRKAQQRRKEMPERKAYPSDLTDAQWEVLEPLIPARAEDATNVSYERREIVNGILYVLRSGCPWRLVPHDLPAWGTLYWYFRTWRDQGVWDQILQTLRKRVREKQGREPEPSAAVIDSQSIKTSAVRGPQKGYDAGKKNLGTQTECTG
jgi:transposase